ncbi:MAG: hypothetical protein NVSMB6_14950 [Burkholderiaceae bacterium]
MLSVLALGAGIYLGLHFSVLVLVPASLLGVGTVVLVSWGLPHDLWEAGGLLLPLISLQAGYIIGLSARDGYRSLRERRNVVQSNRI